MAASTCSVARLKKCRTASTASCSLLAASAYSVRLEQFSLAATWSMVSRLNPSTSTISTSASRRWACRLVSRGSEK